MTLKYDRSDYLAGLSGYRLGVRKLCKALAARADDDGLFQMSRVEIRTSLHDEAGLRPRECAEAWREVRSVGLVGLSQRGEIGRPAIWKLTPTASAPAVISAVPRFALDPAGRLVRLGNVA